LIEQDLGTWRLAVSRICSGFGDSSDCESETVHGPFTDDPAVIQTVSCDILQFWNLAVHPQDFILGSFLALSICKLFRLLFATPVTPPLSAPLQMLQLHYCKQ